MTETLANLIADVLITILHHFDGINLGPLEKAFEVVTPYIQTVLFILPAGTIAQIFTITVTIWGFRLIIRLIKTIWQLLPLV